MRFSSESVRLAIYPFPKADWKCTTLLLTPSVQLQCSCRHLHALVGRFKLAMVIVFAASGGAAGVAESGGRLQTDWQVGKQILTTAL